MRTAKATDRFILSGGDDVFEPTFTFHGFRYVEVDGWPGELTSNALTAVVVSSELRRIGEFECSNELLNQLHRNVVWGLRGNFLDVPTDCPQRDERLGWTGDIAVFAPTATYLFDVDDFLRDWLKDLAAEQQAAMGCVPPVVPDILKYVERPSTCRSRIAPRSGATPPSGCRGRFGGHMGIGRCLLINSTRWRPTFAASNPCSPPQDCGMPGFQFGDWLDPTAPPDDPTRARPTTVS